MPLIIPESVTHPLRETTVPLTLILHTNGAKNSVASLYPYLASHPTVRIYPHFQVAWDGTVEQYCPVERQAFAQYEGNAYAISVETQDSGYAAKAIDGDPWSEAQLHAIAILAIRLGVGAKPCTSAFSGGVGYHSQFYIWNKDGHNCPGAARVQQIPKIVEYMQPTVVTNGTLLEENMKLIRDARTGEIDITDGIRRRDPAQGITDVARRIAVASEWKAILGPWVDVSADLWDSLPTDTNPVHMQGTWSTQ